MKKVLFLVLFLVVLGAAGVSAQIRIGGDEAPNAAAVLDLNVNDATDAGTKGLALPRVSLDSNKDKLVYSDLLEGMLVYNTNAGMTDGDGVGVYYWDGSEWVKPAGGSDYEGSSSIVLSGNSLQRAALSGDVTAAENNNTVTINPGSVSRNKTTMTIQRTNNPGLGLSAGSQLTIKLPSGCTYPNLWYSVACSENCYHHMSENGVVMTRIKASVTASYDRLVFYCFN